MRKPLTLVVPGLLWPAPLTPRPTQALELPALAWLLGRGRRTITPPCPFERELARLFDIHGDEISLAALRRRGEAHASASAAHWLCADPVHLSIASGNLLLSEFAPDEIDAAEATALVAALNELYGDIGEFSAPAPTRWYSRLTEPPAAAFSTLHDAAGRPMQHFLPTGEEARRWQRLLNEIQVTLHNHPVNAAREAAGRRIVNSLWFWGSEAYGAPPHDFVAGANKHPEHPRPPYAMVQATDPVARGFARLANIEPAAPQLDAALNGDVLAVLDALAAPARHVDLDAWRAALAALEKDWFAPIACALQSGRLQRLQLFAPGDRCGFKLALGGFARHAFWRKPLALDDLPLPVPR
ncbi:MAG: hypothetical protein LBI92_04480 [Azoarcus sp.]|jgi:hypothetical protein|nr:hypothetical protein [Azoarcus sp.]